jgi:hypothetical protein
MAKRRRLGQKQCPECRKWIKGPRTKKCPHCGFEFGGKKQAATATEPVTTATEAPAKVNGGITLDQIKAVGQIVRTVGGFRRVQDMLAVIKEVGGMKKFKDLLDAMAVSEKEDVVPF